MEMNLQNNVTMNSVQINVKKLSDSNDLVAKCFNECKHFVANTMPLLTYMQISDMMQEFLCLSDQAKLVEVDNKKMV